MQNSWAGYTSLMQNTQTGMLIRGAQGSQGQGTLVGISPFIESLASRQAAFCRSQQQTAAARTNTMQSAPWGGGGTDKHNAVSAMERQRWAAWKEQAVSAATHGMADVLCDEPPYLIAVAIHGQSDRPALNVEIEPVATMQQIMQTRRSSLCLALKAASITVMCRVVVGKETAVAVHQGFSKG